MSLILLVEFIWYYDDIYILYLHFFSNTLEKSVRTPILSSACLGVWSLQIPFPVPQPAILHFKINVITAAQRVYQPESRSTPVRGSAVNLRCILYLNILCKMLCSPPQELTRPRTWGHSQEPEGEHHHMSGALEASSSRSHISSWKLWIPDKM